LKKIAVVSAEDTLNYGSAIMSINLIHYLSAKLGKDSAFVTDVFTQNDIDRMNSELQFRVSLKKLGVSRKISQGSSIQRWEIALDFVKENIAVFSENPTCVVDVGGDNFGEYYYGKGVALDLLRVFAFSVKIPFFIVGQTIGPFYSWREPLAASMLKLSYIYPRNPLKNDYSIQTLQLKRVIEARDLAFLDMPKQANPNYQKEVLKRHQLWGLSFLCVVPSGLSHFYTDNYNDYVNSWAKIINSLLENPALKHFKVILLPHVLSKHHDDRKVIADILKKIPPNNRIQYISDVLLPSEARCILGGGLFTVTARMHAAVSTFQMLKPALCVSASMKFSGVIGEGLGANDLIVKADDKNFWSSGEISKVVNQKVEYILRNYDEIVSKIATGVRESKELALVQINSIAEKIM
jgi:colanic acid/amylovoran biosynthesis protein